MRRLSGKAHEAFETTLARHHARARGRLDMTIVTHHEWVEVRLDDAVAGAAATRTAVERAERGDPSLFPITTWLPE